MTQQVTSEPVMKLLQSHLSPAEHDEEGERYGDESKQFPESSLNNEEEDAADEEDDDQQKVENQPVDQKPSENNVFIQVWDSESHEICRCN